MSFESREESTYEGQPVECYRFTSGVNLWLFTSSDRDVVLPVGTFTREVIKRGTIDLGDRRGDLEVKLHRTNPIGSLFRSFAPEQPLSLILYTAHRDEEDDFRVLWAGRIVYAKFESSEVTLRGLPDGAGFARTLPTIGVQRQCPWDLYGLGCGADKPAFTDSIVVTTVDGAVVTSNDFSARADGWYTNGWLERSNGERRMIVAHADDQVVLKSRFRDLASSEVVAAIAGCDRLRTTCRDKYGNFDVNGRVKFAGFDLLPGRNPYTGRFA